jgi:hypothetical protein
VTTLWLVLGAALAAAAIVLVALPFLRDPEGGDDTIAGPDDEAVRLVEERDRALAGLKELEFDHRTGKIGDDDYRQLVSPLRQAAALALRALDEARTRYGPGVAPYEPPEIVPEPLPPPDEGTPPAPEPVREPYPPPDEATPPVPDPPRE